MINPVNPQVPVQAPATPASSVQPQVPLPYAIRALQMQHGQQMAENGARPPWMDQPLRMQGGQFTMPMTNPNQPLAVSGPAMYQNAMRHIGIKPGDYKK